MNIREKVATIQVQGQTRYVIDIVDLKDYLKDCFEVKLDPGYIASKIRHEVNEILLDIYTAAKQKQTPVEKKPQPKQEEPKKKPAKASLPPPPPPEPEEDEDDDEEALEELEDLPEIESGEEDENVTDVAQDDEIKRLQDLESDLFG